MRWPTHRATDTTEKSTDWTDAHIAGLLAMGVLGVACVIGLIVWIAGWRSPGGTQAWPPAGKS